MTIKEYLAREEEVPKGMSGMECIFYAISKYKNKNPKLYWMEEECISDALACLRKSGQDNEENMALAVKIVGERLAK